VNKVVFLISKEKIQQWKLKNNTEAASMISGEVTVSQMVGFLPAESQPLCRETPQSFVEMSGNLCF